MGTGGGSLGVRMKKETLPGFLEDGGESHDRIVSVAGKIYKMGSYQL